MRRAYILVWSIACLVWLLWLLLSAPWARSAGTYEMPYSRIGDGMYRYENQEVVCYAYYEQAVSCFKKTPS